MTIAFAIFGVAFSALCVWLGVRIVNRRERWAKWTLAGVLGMPVLYVASFGPACWWFSQPVELPFVGMKARRPPAIYSPIGWTARRFGTGNIQRLANWYATAVIPDGEGVACGILERDDPGIVFVAN